MQRHGPYWALLLCGALLWLAPGNCRAQMLMEVKGFRVAQYYSAPHERQMKSLLEGARAQPQPGGRWLVLESKLQTFGENGEPELVVEAPQSIQDPTNHTVSSSGPLQARSGDGKFFIEGEGFLCQQTNSSLFISNKVHTIAQADMLAPASSRKSSGAQKGPIEIFSDRFGYAENTGLGTYEGNVRVRGTNMSLTSRKLMLELPMKERRLRSVTAEEQVVIDYTDMQSGSDQTNDIHATGGRAVYGMDSGLVKLTGHPAWRAGLREGHADELIIDHTNKVFFARGNALLKMPGHSGGTAGFLPETDLPGAKASHPATNVTVAIESDSYEIRTNAANFNGNVRVSEFADKELRGTMSCGQMNTAFSSKNELQQMVAEKDVVIEQRASKLKAGRAVYTGADGRMLLTEGPNWQAGPRSGKGDKIIVDIREKEMTVQGNASMTMPASEFARASIAGSTNTLKAKSGTNEFAKIFADRYHVREQEGGGRLAMFHGGVYITHPQMNWACETLTVRLPETGGQIDNILADENVVFDLIDEQGHKVHGLGDKAIYTYSVTNRITNDIVQVFGTPALLQTTNATITNKTLVLDLAEGKLLASGSYGIRGMAPAVDTNKFQLPNSKILK